MILLKKLHLRILFSLIFISLSSQILFTQSSQNQWILRRDKPDKTTIVGYLNHGGMVYSGSTVLNINPQIDNINYIANWSAGTTMPEPTRYHGSGCMWINSTKDTAKLICFGGDTDGSGNTSNLTNIYNLTTNSWSLGPNVSAGRFVAFACCVGDSAYFMGGIGGTGGSFASEMNTVDVYNVKTNTMTLGPVLPYTYADARALPYQDSIIYIVGGLIDGTSYAIPNVFLFNRQTATYRAATSLPVARSGFAGVIVGDTIYVVCGGTGYNTGLANTLYMGQISQSNRATITWTTGTNYPGTSLHRFYAEKWGCKGFITGIGSISGYSYGTECYVYKTDTHTWQIQPNATIGTCAYFSGSATVGTAGITKWVVASGVILTPPYSIPFVQIFTDSLCGTLVGIANNRNEIPTSFSLYQNYPNPFNPTTKIRFDIPKTSFTKIIIYDILGHEVAILVNDQLKPGSYEVEWGASNYSSGVYFYKLTTAEYTKTKRMVLVK